MGAVLHHKEWQPSTTAKVMDALVKAGLAEWDHSNEWERIERRLRAAEREGDIKLLLGVLIGIPAGIVLFVLAEVLFKF